MSQATEAVQWLAGASAVAAGVIILLALCLSVFIQDRH